MHGHTDLLELLLEAGAEINSKTKTGATPLHWAVAHGQQAAVELLPRVGPTSTRRTVSTNLRAARLRREKGAEIGLGYVWEWGGK